MPPRIDFTQLVTESEYLSEDSRDAPEERILLEKAKAFMLHHRWCVAIEACYVGIAIEGVVGVFLFRIDPGASGADEWLWAVVGDLPFAYLVTDDASTPRAALAAYIREMREWVDAAKNSRPVDQLIPVGVSPTVEHAENLARRLDFLEQRIVRDD